MSGAFEDVITEELTINGLFRELRDLTRRLQRLEELKAPKVIIDYDQQKFDAVLNQLLKYLSMETIQREMKEKWLNRKWKDDYRP